MEHKEFDVEVVFRERAIYRVSAEDPEAAERVAVELWQQGAESEVPGYGWCELVQVEAGEATGTESMETDAELILRFLQERERLILRLGGTLVGSAANDAISASQVAADLGWVRRSPESARAPDMLRATRALEWLCSTRRAVCFERPRVRSGERGDIRLYCTPEYLEHLSSSIEGLEPQRI